ncbi:MAG: hypothetical protein ACK5QK_05500 [Chryseotalea sp.]
MRLGYKIGLGILTVIVVILGVIWISPSGQFIRSADLEEDKQEFDKKLWTVNWDKGRNDENDRHFMLTDLTENHLKIGMDSVEVKRLLGEPERDFGFSYNLGLYRSGFDPTFLILEFDEEGKLKEIKIETI